MQRWTTVVVGAFLVAIIGALVWKGGRGGPVATGARIDAGHEATHDERTRPDGSVFDDPLFTNLLEGDGGMGLGIAEVADSEPGIPLPSGTPKTVRFGVILVQYRGAQQAPGITRSKEEALTLARSLAESAKTDFKAQVAKGDPGSMDDAGRIPRGVLEPPAEFALFTLSPGSVSDPIDTPRGFWIVKRIE